MRPRDRAALILVALAVTFSVLAVGGAPRWAACIGALLGLASAAPYLTSRRTSSRPSPLLLPLAVAAGLTALQLVPLPHAIASQVCAAKLDLVTANAAALDEPAPTWVMASYDPPATLVELAKLLGYLGLAYTCVRLATIRRARRALASIVAGVATGAALITLFHHAIGATSLFGVITPTQRPHILGPLFGVNHLASLLSIAVPIALALALASSRLQRIAWLTAAATLAATTLLTGSRGGLIGLIVGVIVALSLLIVQGRGGLAEERGHSSLVVRISAVVIGICTVVLIAILTAGDVANDMQHTELSELHEPHSKFHVWDRSTTLITDNRWLGVGRGAFEPAFTRVSDVGDLTYTHAENDYLQAVIDWGLPGAAVLCLSVLTAGRAGLRRWRHGPLEAGVIGGIASLLIHDLADFSLEMPAVACVSIVAAAVVIPDHLSTATNEAGTRVASAARRTVGTRATAIALATCVVALASAPPGRSMREDAARVMASKGTARLALARWSWHRHPSDYILAGRTAEALFEARDALALPVIARAIELAPLHAGLHYLAGQVLAETTARSQAAVEFSIAARLAFDVRPIVEDVLRTFPDAATAAGALPPEPDQEPRIIFALGARKDVALAYAARVAERYPRDATAQWMLALQAMNLDQPTMALPAARSAWTLQPVARHANLFGRALAATGARADAIALLVTAETSTRGDPTSDRVELLFALSEIEEQAADVISAKGALDRAEELAKGNLELLLSTHRRLEQLAVRMENPNQAAYEHRLVEELGRTMSAE